MSNSTLLLVPASSRMAMVEGLDFMKRLSWLPELAHPGFLPPPPLLPCSNSFRTTARIRSTRRNCHRHPKRARMSDKPFANPVTTTTMPSPTTFLYFCYGSNMLRSKLSSRGPASAPPITFTDVFKARLSNWQLCFDLYGAPPQEPAMASIQPEEGDEVHGVVYRIGSTTCWEKLLKSEGVTEPQGPYDSYHVASVTVECFVNEKYVEMSAMTLVTNPRFRLQRSVQPLVRPSTRYMNILTEGAKQECLPKHYVKRLENTPVARQWKPSLLLNIMILSIPLVFLSRRRGTRIFTYPLSSMGMVLYATHESIVRHPDGWSVSRGIGMMMCKIALLLLYSLYAIPSALVAACSPMGRQMVIVLMKKPFGSRADKPIVHAAK